MPGKGQSPYRQNRDQQTILSGLHHRFPCQIHCLERSEKRSSPSLPQCRSACELLWLFFHLSFGLSAFLSVNLSVCLSAGLPACLPAVCRTVCLSTTWLIAGLPVCVSFCLPLGLSACPSIRHLVVPACLCVNGSLCLAVCGMSMFVSLSSPDLTACLPLRRSVSVNWSFLYFQSIWLPVCLRIGLVVCLLIPLYVSLSVYLLLNFSACLRMSLFIARSAWLSVCLSLAWTVNCLYVNWYVCLSVRPLVSQSIGQITRPPIRLTAGQSVYLYVSSSVLVESTQSQKVIGTFVFSLGRIWNERKETVKNLSSL